MNLNWLEWLGLVTLILLLLVGQVWAYRHGRIGRQWRLFDLSEPLTWLGPLALLLLPAYLIGRANPRVRDV